jgi:hypothetical protein
MFGLIGKAIMNGVEQEQTELTAVGGYGSWTA